MEQNDAKYHFISENYCVINTEL